MKIGEMIREDLILPEVRSSRKDEVIRELAGFLASNDDRVTAADVTRVLLEREKQGSTALGEGIAVPHGKLGSVDELIACLGRSRRGVDFGAADGKPTHFFFVIVAPPSSAGDHLKALARISRVFRDDSLRDRLMDAETAEEMQNVIGEAEGDGLR